MNFADSYNKKYYIQKILTQPELLAAYCAATNMPLIACSQETFNDRAFVFDGEERLKEFAGPYLEKKVPVRGVRFPAKDKMKFFSTLLSIGIDELVYVDHSGKHAVRLADFIKKQDFSGLPQEKRPIENPQLQMSGLYFVQEASRNVPPEEKENLKELEEELAANLVKAVYILPVIFEDQKTPASQNAASDSERNAASGASQNTPADAAPDAPGQTRQFKIPLIKTKQEEVFMPLFTDSIEFAKYNQGGKCSAMVVPFASLEKALVKEAKGYMLNPNGFHIQITMPLLKGLTQRFPKD